MEMIIIIILNLRETGMVTGETIMVTIETNLVNDNHYHSHFVMRLITIETISSRNEIGYRCNYLTS